MAVCRICNGAGFTFGAQKCEGCGGSGEIESPETKVPYGCPNCGAQLVEIWEPDFSVNRCVNCDYSEDLGYN